MKGALELLDRVLSPLVWIVAAALALMLFVGPQLVAEDEPAAQPSGAAAADPAPDGEQLFVESCGSCHTLSAAGTSGQTGPALDGAGLSADLVAETVSSGRGVMPSFSGSLDEAQIEAVADYVQEASQP